MNNSTLSSEGNFRHLINERIAHFWGYGELDSDVWFVGMEEGCDGSIPKLIKRFEATSNGEVFDICDDMGGDADHMAWFTDGAPTQATYRKLIYLLRYFQTSKEPSLEDIREYQINHFGRKNNDHALLELMPLPARSLHAKDWVYASSGIEGLSSRREYLKMYKPERIKRLRELIQKHKPKVVICYSMVYLEDWREITDAPFHETIPKKLYVAKDDHTVYAVVPHSVAHGVSNNDWKQIAEKIMEATTRR
ncbi:MAG: hypothetical protein A2845_05965 [Candidatus Lloydbacteria bacterium RIFCSPHIGHO2_01_FULL_49_22]|uniref:Uncharacterized protein n=1 Tax=Candidatus Lloydbacteria bacterium RIFCSPHIGHO2_01_FULL_49_22 TaxID=1798658 RepID=A0A1G2CVZ8_9BACT|nr:MAG: hypothetical protein A2845_05965 [Candidatus Lloydbacteria bacterium RIFCSPHIGHO2_01_FULL_49_22]OGZ09775.1 MAG: hypothetical protein A3C14_00050 [Candidatus Lloydbacteria bacterium RIFCSPHIGHO2_02_FULL_50_18]